MLEALTMKRLFIMIALAIASAQPVVYHIWDGKKYVEMHGQLNGPRESIGSEYEHVYSITPSIKMNGVSFSLSSEWAENLCEKLGFSHTLSKSFRDNQSNEWAAIKEDDQSIFIRPLKKWTTKIIDKIICSN